MKLIKTILLLFIVAFMSSCGTDTTDGIFEVTNVEKYGDNSRYVLNINLQEGDSKHGQYIIKYSDDRFSIGDKLILKVVDKSEDHDFYISKIVINQSIYFKDLKYKYLITDEFETLHVIDNFYYATDEIFKLSTCFKFVIQGYVEPNSSQIRRDGININ